MKISSKDNSAYYIILIAILFIISCSKKETPTPNPPPPPTPTNTAPSASFTVSPTSGDVNTVFTFNASACSDGQTAVTALQVRWDFNGDGTYDTGWGTGKTQSGTFPSAGTYTAKLEVKDAGGLVGSTTKSIIVESGAFTDSRDGSVYTTTTVGGFTWMDDNLRYEIPGKQITDASAWAGNSSYDGWAYYDNDKDTYGELYGILYQFEAAIAAIPDGWHLPTELEIRALTEGLGGASVAGGALKETGTDHWTAPNTGATNSTGYTALPAGLRNDAGSFQDVGSYAAFWTSTIYSLIEAWFWLLSYDDATLVGASYPKKTGFTVRVVKDQDNNTAPAASFTVSPGTGDVSTEFAFDASGSSDEESSASKLNVRWDFDNDGTFDTEWSTTKTVNHTYESTGTYTAKLELEDEGGLMSSTTKSIVVSDEAVANTAPTASLTVDPTSGDINTGFYFDASGSSDAETATTDLQVRWDVYNDGSYESDWTTDKLMNLTFSNAGTYTIKVEVKDEGGLIASATVTIVVSDVAANTAPTASFSWDPETGDTETQFTFDASASSDTETATDDLQVKWTSSGGNGTNYFSSSWTTGKTVTQSFYRSNDAIASDYPMTYSIKLEVKDSDGLMNSQSKELIVEAPPYPVGKFTVSPEEGYTWTIFTFDASDSWDGQSAIEYSWHFDYCNTSDGSDCGVNNNFYNSGLMQTPITTFSYPSVGNWYYVVLDVKDEDGNWNRFESSTASVNILPNTDPTASFTVDQSTAMENTTFSFDASGSTDTESNTDSLYVRWDFDNDGTFEVDWTKTKITTHAYSTAATYTVKMEVKDQGGLIDSYTSTVEVLGSTYTDSRDNETYNIVAIGEQIWFAENLRYEISGKEITDNSTFQNNNAYDGWSYFDNDKATNGTTYGILYQWEAAKTACPSGWHLSSDAEWKTLEVFLGMPQDEADAGQGSARTVAGTKLRSTSGWYSTGNGTNSSGFTALPAGARTDQFYSLTYWGYWWTSSEGNSSSEGWSRAMEWSGIDYIQRNGSPKYYGQSVRCLKD